MMMMMTIRMLMMMIRMLMMTRIRVRVRSDVLHLIPPCLRFQRHRCVTSLHKVFLSSPFLFSTLGCFPSFSPVVGSYCHTAVFIPGCFSSPPTAHWLCCSNCRTLNSKQRRCGIMVSASRMPPVFFFFLNAASIEATSPLKADAAQSAC